MNRFQFYADNTELSIGQRESNVFILGGLACNENTIRNIERIVNSIKKKYGGQENLPIKWNFKDLKKDYEGNEDSYYKLLKSSHYWRTEIASEIAKLDVHIFISILQRNPSAKPLKDVKEEIISIYFSQLLMTLAYFSKIQKCGMTVNLDWPENSNTQPFASEYKCAYHGGKSKYGIPYFAGPLKALNFNECPNFINCTDSVMMQVADIIVGSFKDYIKLILNVEKYSCLGEEISRMFLPKVNGFPNNINYGLKVSVLSGHKKLLESEFSNVIFDLNSSNKKAIA